MIYLTIVFMSFPVKWNYFSNSVIFFKFIVRKHPVEKIKLQLPEFMF